MSTIEVHGATKSFGSKTLFRNLTFSVPTGQLMAVMGASGSGKSTLLNCLGLLERLDGGSLIVGGEKISAFSSQEQRRFRRDSLGYMFQNYALIESSTIQDNLEVALAPAGKAKIRTTDFDGALEHVGLGGRGKEMVYSLSGGEQQRVALARLIVKRPALVLADEPTGALDSTSESMVMKELRNIAAGGATVLIATHSTAVMNHCDTVLELS
ncbi:lipoprotein ABC transporter ATP-binding protein [Glutamicibacter sp. BW80]|uniref:ABC transporter ATP-binding protein n=1 Tax=unclassified Glutamicibacter TaxID=2627139 RepID=UPI000BB73D9B|nr:ATP-binding cassette domain-containing protein [Glutamicibacter sp. BW80]PCC28848.1 lipoprotein ABC transporter ATP-binding protein [Glutamicibacter sp. BW80]